MPDDVKLQMLVATRDRLARLVAKKSTSRHVGRLERRLARLASELPPGYAEHVLRE